MSAVQHPNLVLLFGVCIERGQLSILMEFAELGTLREQLDKDLCMPAWRRFQLLFGVVNGVRKLHAHTPSPIVHGDLKSLNVLITIDAATGGWVAKITDFGLTSGSGLTNTARMARRYREQCAATEKHGAGTVSHSPPEVLDDVSPCTSAGDVFSLGVIAWEVATGEMPWEGKQPGTIMRQVCDKKRRLALGASPPEGSVFDATQWALFKNELLPGGQDWSGGTPAAAGGCWAHEPAERPAPPDIFRSFQRAAQRFRPPAGAAGDLQVLLQHLCPKMDGVLAKQEAVHREAMHRDMRREEYDAMRARSVYDPDRRGGTIQTGEVRRQTHANTYLSEAEMNIYYMCAPRCTG
jgi:serine/threonine protein kinase